mmetsp:Transcript_92721/g.299977  ORF Transcript_92721/g.299977 Transcript_92721/m.299977 type:complete len:627 (-) Transcript_92721:42-1922(-)
MHHMHAGAATATSASRSSSSACHLAQVLSSPVKSPSSSSLSLSPSPLRWNRSPGRATPAVIATPILPPLRPHYDESTSRNLVQLAVSLSRGPVANTYHTSLLVGGEEFAYGPGGIVSSPWPRSHAQHGQGAPRIVDMGSTARSSPGVELLEGLSPLFGPWMYEVETKNCSSFVDCALYFLLGFRLDTVYHELKQGPSNRWCSRDSRSVPDAAHASDLEQVLLRVSRGDLAGMQADGEVAASPRAVADSHPTSPTPMPTPSWSTTQTPPVSSRGHLHLESTPSRPEFDPASWSRGTPMWTPLQEPLCRLSLSYSTAASTPNGIIPIDLLGDGARDGWKEDEESDESDTPSEEEVTRPAVDAEGQALAAPTIGNSDNADGTGVDEEVQDEDATPASAETLDLMEAEALTALSAWEEQPHRPPPREHHAPRNLGGVATTSASSSGAVQRGVGQPADHPNSHRAGVAGRAAASGMAAAEVPNGAGNSASSPRGSFWTSLAIAVGRWRSTCGCGAPPDLPAHEGDELELQLGPQTGGGHQTRRSAALTATTVVQLTEATFDAFTVLTVQDGQEDTSSGGCECPVCFEPFLEGEEIRTLPCMHRYHKECIDRWLFKRPACAKCKQSIFSFVA